MKYSILIVSDHSRRAEKAVSRLNLPQFEVILGTVKIEQPPKDWKCLRFDRWHFSNQINRLAKEATGKYLIIINDDVFIQDQQLHEHLIEDLNYPNVGAVQALLFRSKDLIDSAGVDFVLRQPHPLAFFAPHNRFQHKHVSEVKLKREEVAAATFGFIALKRELFLNLGGLDENFQIEFQDVDFSLRLKERRYKILFDPRIWGFHLSGKSRAEAQKEVDSSSDFQLYLNKWGARNPYTIGRETRKKVCRVLALQADRSASFQYRINLPLRRLSRHSEKFKVSMTQMLDTGKDLRDIKVLICQRQFRLDMLEAIISEKKKRGFKLVYEIDDDITSIPKWNPFSDFWLPRKENVFRWMEASDAIFLSTEPLKEAYRSHYKRAFVLPNCIEPEIMPSSRIKNNRRPVIGWAGSSTHRKDLEILVEPLKKILEQTDSILKTFGCEIPGLPQISFNTFVPFEINYAILASMDFDIGLAPLDSKTKFNRSKSDIKWLEYSWLETATIASKTEPFISISNRKDGYLVEDDGWFDAILDLLENRSLREKMAQNAKKRIIEERNLATGYKLWENALLELIEG